MDKKATYFYVQEVYKRTLSLLSSKFKSNEIEIIENIQDVKLFGFENEFIQVLMNLFTNAKDALEEVETKRLIFIDVYENNEYQIIKIKDNAGGIPKKILKKVFEPYFTTKSEDEGTGIGLYMAEEIIQKHMQGELLVKNQTFEYENKVYKGAEFTIRFKSKSS
jgi:signal transduction histidine kinase